MADRLNHYIYSETQNPDLATLDKEVTILEYPAQKTHVEFVKKFNIKEGEKTAVEKQICDDMLKATEEVLREIRLGNVGKYITLRSEDIHILKREEFDRIDALEEEEDGKEITPSDGFARFGSVYMPHLEESSEFDFAMTLSHEVAHTISRLSFSFKHEQGKLEIIPKAVGMRRDMPEGEDKFDGLNEAVNELLATKIREKYIQRAKKTSYLPKDLVELRAYPEAIWVLEEVLQRTAGDKKYNVLNQLFRDHITGVDTVLKVLAEKKPKIYDALRDMGTKPEDALEVAKKLEYEDVITEIEMRIHTRLKTNNKKIV